MADASHKPVIFLAFTNDRDDTVGYLRNLPDEARLLRDVLTSAEQAGLCEVEVRSNSTAADIFKVFQDPKYRNRIAVFHYGGHANGYQLLLESAEGQTAAADAGGLAAFLAQQQGLQLVFLNGCSTQQQTQGLLDANVPAVISTSRSIDDRVATDFSCQFYQGLAGGATIRTAYNEAAAAARTAKGGDTRALYFGSTKDSQSVLEADRWPWNLCLREGSEHVDQWNLPEAVNDPLFGLPPLPEQDLPDTPYRHLNWFTRQHAEVFFGRGHQIRELYDRLTAPRSAPIILFYGQSGVGKSSILDAGLIPRLEHRYEVRYLRRTAGGLLDTLQLAFLPEASDEPLESAWRVKEQQTGKPLIVFLDQVEEHFTRPIADMPDELEQLLKVVQATFGDPNRRPQGKLVLGFRKEWLAELESHLVSYELPRTKVFLERLDRRGIIEVVLGPARSERLRERFGLTVEDGLAGIIADDLLEDHGSAIAPTLQILLTKMWTKASDANYEHPHFGQDLYQHLKRDGILLRDFLNQQIAAFRERYPEAVDSGLLLDIVALHTTPLGTANECTVEQLQQQYAHLAATLPDLLQQCQDLYLLTVAASSQKESTKTTRLAHDTLAPLVREQFDVSDKPGQRARRILDNRSVDWVDAREGIPLDEADLKIVEQGIVGTRALSVTEQRLMEASRKLRRKLQRNRKLSMIVGAVAVAVIAGLGAFGWWNYNEAKTANVGLVKKTREADDEKSNAVSARKQAEAHAREANRQSANAFWQLASTARDQNQGVNAAFNYLLAAQAYDRAGDQLQRHNNELTAQFATSGLVRSFPHDSAVRGVEFSSDQTRVLTWNDDGELKLWELTKAEPIQVWNHDDQVYGAVFTRDESSILSWSRDGTLRLWDATEGKSIQVWKHNGAVIGAFFTRDESRVLAWSYDGSIKLWDVTNAEPTRIWKHDGDVIDAVFTNDESRILAWSADGAVKLWDVTKAESIQVWNHSGRVYGAVFTRDETRVLTWSTDCTVKLWDAGQAEPAQVWEHDHVISGATFTRDESRVLSWSADGVVKLWDVVHAEPIQVWKHDQPITGHSGAIFTSDESRVLVWSTDSTVRLLDVTKTEPIQVWKHDHLVISAMFTRDESRVLAWSRDGAVTLWDVKKARPIQMWKHDGHVRGVVFASDEFRVLSWSDDGAVKLWDVTKAEPIQVWKQDSAVRGAMFVRDESRIVTWRSDGAVNLWDVKENEPIQNWKHSVSGASVSGATFTGGGSRVLTWGSGLVKLWVVTKAEPLRVWEQDDTVIGAVFTKNESRFLAWSSNGSVNLWDIAKSTPLRVWKQDGWVIGAAFTRDENRVLTASLDGTVKLWDVIETEPLREWKHNVEGAVLTRNESRLLVWGSSSVKLWDVTQPEPLQVWKHGARVQGALFTHDENRVLAWSNDGAVKLWDVTKTEPIQMWTHGARVQGALFTHDENRVLAWSDDGAVKLWDVTKTEPIQVWTHGGNVRSAVFTSDESRILSNSENVVKLWDVTKADPIRVWKRGPQGTRMSGAVFTHDESRILAWSADGAVKLWDVTKAEPIQVWNHSGRVYGAVFTRDESLVLAWSHDGTVRLWDAALRDIALTPFERIMELKVQSSAQLNSAGQLVPLNSDEWTNLVRSHEFAAIQRKKKTTGRVSFEPAVVGQ